MEPGAEQSSLLGVSDEAYRRIRQMLMDGALPPNTVIPEMSLAKDLGISRTPVREGLRRLQAEGLMKKIPNRGFLVVELSRDELRDVYSVRAVLEGLASEQAAERAGRVDVARLEDLMEAMSGTLEEENYSKLSELNREFHAAVASASGNAFLRSMLESVDAISQRFRPAAVGSEKRRREAHVEHGELLERIRNGRSQEAKELAGQHAVEALSTRLDGSSGDSN